MVCPACQSSLPEGAKFCIECGAALSASCPSCGAQHAAGQRFCAECGQALVAAAATAPGRGAVRSSGTASSVTAPTELRLVSVLFVDLVAFTTLSESRDAEDVREILGRYFGAARTIVERYGGTVEKFIGDAVMAVWGASMALEDDGERAVRAGLEILTAVGALGHELGSEQLSARAGVVTGQAAAVDNPGEGIVVGDRVNTAARVQSVAAPGSLFVDEVTRRVASGAILFEDAGEHEVKGKAEPLRLWRALRVVAGAGGRGRDTGREAPFCGRDGDLRLLKELFHSSTDRGMARLVAIYGEAGVGKSRLLAELSNYTDGLADSFLWHTGRCLAHGDGVAYWALAEMVRQRFGIPEDAPEAQVSAKLAAGLHEWLPDAADREFVAPAVAALLGVGEPGIGQPELFGGWRLLFERLAAHDPVAMVFEDMQWADAGLLQFIEQLVDWSASLPIFVVVLARPELATGRDGWPAGRRGATTIQLERLGDEDLRAIVLGLVPDLPAEAVERIVAQAQGVPLYGTETIRTLVDRGAVVERDGGLALEGELGELEVPPTLSALITARIDALTPDERELVKAMSVFGGAFSRGAALALAELPEERLDAALDGLLRRQVLSVGADPLSPDRGQYAFAQGLLRNVAYELLSRRERKARHLAAAVHLRRAFAGDGEEVSEVIAAHQLAAYEAAREDDDADALRIAAVEALRRAGQRAGALGGPDTAQRLYTQAGELSSDEHERAKLMQLAGEMAADSGRSEEAIAILDEVAAAHARAGRERERHQLAGASAPALWYSGRAEEAVRRLTEAVQVLGGDPFDHELAKLNASLGRFCALGNDELSGPALRAALSAAEALGDQRLLSDALGSQAIAMLLGGRPQQAVFTFAAAIDIAERHEFSDLLVRAQLNAGNTCMLWDMPEARGYAEAALAGSRRMGQRMIESIAAANLMYADLLSGRWEEVERLALELLDGNEQRPGREYAHWPMLSLMLARGELESARVHLGELNVWRDNDDPEVSAMHTAARVGLGQLEHRPQEALELGMAMLGETIARLSVAHDAVRVAWPDTLEAALVARRLDEARAVLALLSDRPRGLVPPYLHAHLARGRARVAIAAGEDGDQVELWLRDAVARFAALGYSYWLAVTQAELGTWLAQHQREDEAQPLLDAAFAELTRLRARPCLEAYFSTRAIQAEGSSISASVGSAAGAANS